MAKTKVTYSEMDPAFAEKAELFAKNTTDLIDRAVKARVDEVSKYVGELERENELLKARVEELVGYAGHELDQARFRHLLALLRDYLAHRGGVTFMDLHRFVRENFK